MTIESQNIEFKESWRDEYQKWISTFDLFRKYAKRSGRMEEADLMDDNHGLLEKLRLYEGSYLKRATALLFHPDPEKYVTGAKDFKQIIS